MNAKNLNSEEMINRYVNEVGEQLPGKTRADIEQELRSLIQDAVDDRSGASGEAPATEVVATVLKEFGAPSVIAARYRPAEVLIGAQLFPVYRKVLTIVLSIIVVVTMVGLIVSLAQNESGTIGQIIPAMFAGFWEAVLINAAIVTLIFAIIERVGGDSVQAELGKNGTAKKAVWDPYQLPPVADPDRIKWGDLLGGIIVNLFLIGGFTFFFDSIGIIDFDRESTRIGGFFAQEFRQHIQWLRVWWALDILLKIMVLVQGRWNRLTRWLELGVALFGFYVLAQILASDSITTVAAFTTLAKLSIGIVMVIAGIDLVGKLYRLLKGQPAAARNVLTSQVA